MKRLIALTNFLTTCSLLAMSPQEDSPLLKTELYVRGTFLNIVLCADREIILANQSIPAIDDYTAIKRNSDDPELEKKIEQAGQDWVTIEQDGFEFGEEQNAHLSSSNSSSGSLADSIKPRYRNYIQQLSLETKGSFTPPEENAS